MALPRADQEKEITKSIEKIITDYKEKTKDEEPNPDRIESLNYLQAVSAFITYLKDKTSPEYLDYVHIAAELYVLQCIAAEYKLSNPRFSTGYVYNSGSRLYKLTMEQLQEKLKPLPEDLDKIIYLTTFSNLAFGQEHAKIFSGQLEAVGLDANVMKEKLSLAIKTIYSHVISDTKRLLAATPTEDAISGKMVIALNYYVTGNLEKKKLPEEMEIKFAKLIVAANELLNEEKKEEEYTGYLSRTQRIKMALLLNVMQYIWNTYWVYSPRNNNVLYDFCCEVLNVDKVTDLSDETLVRCFNTLGNWLEEHKAELENRINKLCIEILEKNIYTFSEDQDTLQKWTHLINTPVYVDSLINILVDLNVKKIESLKKNSLLACSSTVAISAAVLAGIFSAVPGYGLGYVAGNFISDTDMMEGPKIAVSKMTNAAIVVTLGKSAEGYLGRFFADLIVEATVKRGFSKVFETLSMLVGAATGGLVTLIIYDFSARTLTNLYNLCTHLNKTLNLAKDADPKLVQCLKDLPSQIFPREDKKKINYLTTQVMYQPKKKNNHSPDAGPEIAVPQKKF